MTVEVDRTFDSADAVLDQIVAEVVAQLRRTGGAPVDAIHVRMLVEQEWTRHDDARVRTFLPVLVRRAVIGQVLDRGHRKPVE